MKSGKKKGYTSPATGSSAPSKKKAKSKKKEDLPVDDVSRKEIVEQLDEVEVLPEEEDEDMVAEQEVPSKLDDGFYEIEDVRRKRIRKGQVQYLIKWRGWPETANTWEPFDNLQTVKDVIEAFEERASKSTKRRKRKAQTPIKKKKTSTPTNLLHSDRRDLTRDGEEGIENEESVAEATNPLGNNYEVVEQNGADDDHEDDDVEEEEEEEDAGSNVTGKDDNKSKCEPDANRIGIDEIKKDGKDLTINGQIDIFTAVDESNCKYNKEDLNMVMEDANRGQTILDEGEVSPEKSDQNNKVTGARKRKAGSVKRFLVDDKKENGVSPNVMVLPCSNQSGIQVAELVGGSSSDTVTIPGCSRTSHEKFVENPLSIVKILKAVNYMGTIHNNIQDVSVKFLVSRSDGSEITVDNKFMKTNCPNLLIDFYEQHLRYTST